MPLIGPAKFQRFVPNFGPKRQRFVPIFGPKHQRFGPIFGPQLCDFLAHKGQCFMPFFGPKRQRFRPFLAFFGPERWRSSGPVKTRINNMLKSANIIETGASIEKLNSYDGAWYTEYIGPTYVTIPLILME